MRYLKFENFVRDYAKSLNSKKTLSLFKSEKIVQSNSQFLEVMTFYLLFNERAQDTLELNKESLVTLYRFYMEAKKKYINLDKSNLDHFVLGLSESDALNQLYNSYKNLKLNAIKQEKTQLLKAIKNQMKLNNITKYHIYSRLHLNPGNTNNFLKNERIDKLSIENIKKIYHFCFQTS